MSKNTNYGKDNLNTLYDFIKTWCEQVPDKHNPYNPHDSLNFSSKVIGAINYHYYWTLADSCELAVTVETENNISPIRLV